MFAQPQLEHHWLKQLVGKWEFDHRCTMPDGSQSVSPGKMTCRLLGELWLICESVGGAEEGGAEEGGAEEGGAENEWAGSSGGAWSSIMTLGFNSAQNQYVGTFVGSMMTNIWPYHGVVDESGKKLPLNSEGPTFDGAGVAKYRDTIEIIDADTWLFTSELQTDEGEWVKFLDGKHVRSKR